MTPVLSASLSSERRRADERLRWQIVLERNSERVKATRLTAVMLDVLFDTRHETLDEITARARQRDAEVSQTTVLRYVRRYCDLGLLAEVDLGEGRLRFEARSGGQHDHAHGHLVCRSCGAIEDFLDASLARAQNSDAATRGFVVERARVDLFGVCEACGRNEGVRGAREDRRSRA